jgi:hypothetical protein
MRYRYRCGHVKLFFVFYFYLLLFIFIYFTHIIFSFHSHNLSFPSVGEHGTADIEGGRTSLAIQHCRILISSFAA